METLTELQILMDHQKATEIFIAMLIELVQILDLMFYGITTEKKLVLAQLPTI